MKANINEISLTEYPSIPAYWDGRQNQIHYDKLPSQDHIDDGWRDIINPPYNPSTQRLGSAIKDGDQVTRQIIEIPIQEQEQVKIDQVNSAREEKIAVESKKVIEKQVMDNFQALEDDTEAANNQSIYPLWEDIKDGFPFPKPYKVQAYDSNQLKLFKIIQPHPKQSDWHPNITPASWSKIEINQGGIEIWTQPKGGDKKYPNINPDTGSVYIVEHNGQLWENAHTGGFNVWPPGVFGWTQI